MRDILRSQGIEKVLVRIIEYGPGGESWESLAVESGILGARKKLEHIQP
jgi:hypothetical protein